MYSKFYDLSRISNINNKQCINDKGIVRAIKHKEDKINIETCTKNPFKTLFVANLPLDAQEGILI